MPCPPPGRGTHILLRPRIRAGRTSLRGGLGLILGQGAASLPCLAGWVTAGLGFSWAVLVPLPSSAINTLHSGTFCRGLRITDTTSTCLLAGVLTRLRRRVRSWASMASTPNSCSSGIVALSSQLRCRPGGLITSTSSAPVSTRHCRVKLGRLMHVRHAS